MSVYNADQYLDEAIESILTQTYKDFEFIIINDGSIDTSFDIIKKYAKQDARILVISRENRGLIASLNEGILQAKGKYIVRMDADDISISTRLEEQLQFMENNSDIGISGTAVIFFNENQKEHIWRLASKDKTIKTELLFSSSFAHPTVIMRKELVLKYRLFYDKYFIYAEDYALWVSMVEITKMANLSKPLLKYRVLENSITREANKNYEQRYNVIKKIFERYLIKLDMKNSEEENRLHFDLSVNTRIKEANIDFFILKNYFNKFLRANSKREYFDNAELKKILGKKWLWNLYYKKDMRAVFSKYFFYGLWSIVVK